MKNFVKFFGMIALIAVIGFALVGCDTGNGGGGGSITSVTITGIPSEYNGDDFDIFIFNALPGYSVASDEEEDAVENGSITFKLTDNDYNDFTKVGSYAIRLDNYDDNSEFWYTDGKTLAELGIASEADANKMPRYSLSGNASIAFNKFSKD